MTLSRILFSKTSHKTRICLLAGCATLAILVIVFSKQVDTYSCVAKVTLLSKGNPYTLSDSALGSLVSRWGNPNSFDECFDHFRQ
jgi:hypothetical protein